MDTVAARTGKYSVEGPVLYLAFELGNKEWKLGFSVGFGQRPRVRAMPAGNLVDLQREIELAKKRFGLPETARVVSCYEAGRDGFWLHRYLVEAGVENLVVDSSSIEVNRRFRRATPALAGGARETDGMDVAKLLDQLMRYERGEKKVWHVVRVPGLEAEDRRQFHRELEDLKAERTQHINRIKGLLAGQGVRLEIGASFLERLKAVRLWDGRPMPEGLKARLEREYERLQFIQGQVRELEAQRVEAIRRSADPEVEKVRQLLRLKGIGLNSAWMNTMEFFSWREFRNGKEVGGLAGLTPTPYQSGDSSRERGTLAPALQVQV